MIEVSAASLGHHNEVSAGLSYGGDTFNVAAYYSRLGGRVDYLSALGDDSLSNWMLQRWLEEGVGCEQVVRETGGVPGLYLIQVDENGERSFVYWRDNSPARHLFGSASAMTDLLRSSDAYNTFYLSGITLSLMNDATRGVLFEFAASFRQAGGSVVFDGNYRPVQWPNKAEARLVYEHMYRNVDVALSTAGDEYLLFGESQSSEVVARLGAWGVKEIAIKDGNNDCTLVVAGAVTQVPALQAHVVDTTAAGDSFNAAYLASRAMGMNCLDSVRNGHLLAASVVGYRGAIIPNNEMPVLVAAPG